MQLRKQEFIKFAAIYFVALAVIPLLLRNALPYDMVENLHWGKELQLGYFKHPPLFAWISFFFYKICFSCPESLYILTQLNLLLGLFFVYKTSSLVLENESRALASSLVFMASVCAVFGNEKFNANTILMSLYPMMFFFFIRMIKFRKKTDAVALGIVSALAVVGKYIALGYLGCMGIFMLLNRSCRELFKTSLPYIAVVTFLIGISWHVKWMFDSNFVTLQYALDKSTAADKNYCSCFNFVAMQLIFYASSVWVFWRSYKRKFCYFPCSLCKYSPEEQFVLFITIAPNLLLFTVSLLTGMRIGSYWGTNTFMTIGTYLFILNKDSVDFRKLMKLTKIVATTLILSLFIKWGVSRCFLCSYDPTKATNIRAIARQIDSDWTRYMGSEKMFCLKTDKPMASLHIFLKDSPSSYDVSRCRPFEMFDHYPKDRATVATFLCKQNGAEIKKFRKFYENSILFESTISVIDDYVVYYAFVKSKS